MSEDKDDLKSIKVYRFNNTKESWHEFALKFRVIADYQGYDDIISGKEIAPSEKENLEINDEDDGWTKKSKKAKQSARMANRKGFRDLIMSTDGISLNIVQNTDSDDEQVIKYNVALLATDSISLEKKRRRLNRDTPSEATNYLSQLNEESDTKQGLTTQDEEIESQEAWTMGMPSIDGDISTTNPSEQQIIEDKNKQFLYARAMHASHMIQHHMEGISECQGVIDEYQAMMDDGREMIPLDSDLHKSDPVIIQHIMQMIETDILWYGETFKEVLTELRKKALNEMTMYTGEKLDEFFTSNQP